MLKLEKKEKYLMSSIILLVSVFMLFPAFVGEDAIISIHDNLDSNAGWARMIKDSNTFFTLNSSTPSFDNLSSLYFMQVNYSLYSAVFCLLPTFPAYMINYYISIIVGIVSMFMLLKRLDIEDDFIAVLTSVIFALLPRYYWSSIPVSSIPILVIAFLDIIEHDERFDKKYVLLVFFPLISNFVFVGIFAMGLWLLTSVIISIRSKKININLFASFLFLCIGYILVEFKLFYHALVIKESLNRSIFGLGDGHIFLWFKHYFFNGWYHFASLQKRIIIPVLFIFSVLYFLSFFQERLKTQFRNISKKTLGTIVFLFFLLVTFSFIAALYENNSITSFINTIVPPLSGFNWGRVWILNIPIWYVLFAFLLVQINVLFKRKWPGYFIVVLQLIYVLVIPTDYNDTIKTWYNEVFYKTGIDKVIRIDSLISRRMANISSDFISFKEFFDIQLFEKIKEKINYKNERVVAFGYHPSVLMYNGFHTVDGYNSVMPLSYTKKFGRLLKPEFEINPEIRDYYNSWGGRMYLYHGGHDFYESKRMKKDACPLRVDMKVMREQLNVKYIVSNVEISNANVLNLKLIDSSTHDKSIYVIYVYKI